jgi:drug/metabolite transporter (DMT)-like permease
VKHPRTVAGMALALTALACFAALDTTTKYVTSSLGVSVLLALWFRYAFQAIATTVIMVPVRGWSLLHTKHPKYQALRGTLLLLTSLFTFFSLKYMPLGEFTSIAMITPLVVTLLAATLLAEKVSPLRWALVMGGFAGSLIIIRPGGALFNWSALLPLTMVGTYAAFQILTSKMVKTEDAVTMHFYTGWVGTALASLALPFVWTLPQTPAQWAGLLFMGAMGTVGHFVLILAYRRIRAVTITPLLYAQIGFALFGGWLVFDHVPDGWSLMGMAMIATCGAGAAWLAVFESRLQLEPIEV